MEHSLNVLLYAFNEVTRDEDVEIKIKRNQDRIAVQANGADGLVSYILSCALIEVLADFVTRPDVRELLGDLPTEINAAMDAVRDSIIERIKEKSYEIADSEA